MKKIFLFTISALFILTALALAAVSFFSPSLTEALFNHLSYPILLLLFFLWIMTLAEYGRARQTAIRSFIRANIPGFAFALILAAVIFISTKPFLRVLPDETNLLSVAQSLTDYKKPAVILTGTQYGFLFRALQTMVPARPILFPFFVHILHVLTGYHVWNAFVLNFLALFALFSLIYLTAKKYGGRAWAMAAVLLVASQPLVNEIATSAGFDLLAILFIAICFMLLKSFLEAPSEVRFRFLWIHLLLLAHIRYETFLFFTIILSALLLMKELKKEFFVSPILFTLTPLFLLPLFWQRLIAVAPYPELPVGASTFSFAALIKNSRLFFEHFACGYNPPTAAWINILGIVSFGILLFRFLAHHQGKNESLRKWFWITSFCFMVNGLLFASYYYGDVTVAACSRFYTLFYVALSLLAALLLKRLAAGCRQKNLAVLMLSAIFFLVYHSTELGLGFTNNSTLPRKYRYVMDFLKKQDSRDFLLIADHPGLYTVHQYGAIFPHTANKNKDAIFRDYRRHLFQNVFVIQDIAYSNLKPDPDADFELDPAFELEPVFNVQIDENYFTRISRVKLPPG